MTRTYYMADIASTAFRFQLDADLVEAIVLQESGGDPFARRFEPEFWDRYMKDKREYRGHDPKRWASSIGLMQLMPTTAVAYGFDPEEGPEVLFNPTRNLEVGCRLLRALIEWAKGDVAKALAAYNGGKGNVDKDVPKRYAAQVLQRWDALRKQVS